MRSPLEFGPLIVVDSAPSTQDEVAARLKVGEPVGGVLALDQTKGRGRFERAWVSAPGESLTMSLAFPAYTDWPKPWLVGMCCAVAAAGAIHADLRWPNDLTMGGLKVGGVLTELVPDSAGRKVPVVGIGINLLQGSFPPEIADRATSVALARGDRLEPQALAASILNRLTALPEPESWRDLGPIWTLFDATPGKAYTLPTGETATAIGIGPEGELLASVRGEAVSVMAAEAILGA